MKYFFSLLLFATVVAQAAPSPQELQFFESRIRPLLVENCYKCHSESGDKIRGGLLLDTRAGTLKGGDTGPAIVPGNAEASLLIKAIRYTDKDLQMPPNNKKLTAVQIADLERWVKMGAPDPREKAASKADRYKVEIEQGKKHWAFQPLVKASSALPASSSTIDTLLAAAQKKEGLTPSPRAEKVTLIRRASLDLTGLPPSPEEVQAFLSDSSPDAFAKVVDRLLASPRYGERWGRYWLDLAHYANTKGQFGGGRDPRYLFAHTYRDYVISAFNADLPFNEFIREQLAADFLYPNEPKKLAALGFLSLGNRFNNNANDIIDDRIDLVSKATLGLSVSCARCHDHKFDPIPTADYYSWHGIFASSTEPRELPILELPKDTAAYQAFQREFNRRESQLQDYRDSLHSKTIAEIVAKSGDYLLALHEFNLSPQTTSRNAFVQKRGLNNTVANNWNTALRRAERRHDPVLAPWVAFSQLKPAEFQNKSKELAAKFNANNDPQKPINPAIATILGAPPASLQELAARYTTVFNDVNRRWDAELVSYKNRKRAASTPPPEPTGLSEARYEQLREFLLTPGGPGFLDENRLNQLVERDNRTRRALRDMERELNDLKERHPGSPARVHMLTDSERIRDSAILIAGNNANRGPVVPRQFLQVLSKQPSPFKKGSGRLELADSIVATPLAARVIANRVWLHHFGDGIVKTPDDFGTRTEPPVLPELLDYLASSTVENGWSLKKLHRLIMLSNTYQQSSGDIPANSKVDPDNKYFWKMNLRRLDFEALRDTLLAIGGKLDLTMGGPAVHLDSQPYSTRRTVYGYVDRNNLPNMFLAFDFASPDLTTGKRDDTMIPQQALFMMNSQLVMEQARNISQRSDFRSATTDEAKVDLLFKILFHRSADPIERNFALDYVKAETGNNSGERSAAWTYGYGVYNPYVRKVTTFYKFPRYQRAGHWAADASKDNRLSKLMLNAQGGRPADSIPVIRRWTAPVDGVLNIDGKLKHTGQGGDGIKAFIVSSRLGSLADAEAKPQKEIQSKVQGIQVKRGDTIDFVIDPGADSRTDTFNWPVKIAVLPAGTNKVLEWESVKDFSGEMGAPTLDSWQKLAHLLLQTNELSFWN